MTLVRKSCVNVIHKPTQPRQIASVNVAAEMDNNALLQQQPDIPHDGLIGGTDRMKIGFPAVGSRPAR